MFTAIYVHTQCNGYQYRGDTIECYQFDSPWGYPSGYRNYLWNKEMV